MDGVKKMPDVVRVYCDGGLHGRIAWVIMTPFKKVENITVISELKTMNESEFYAVLRALFDLPNSSIVELFSDSQLVLNGITGDWNVRAPNLIPIIEKIRKTINDKHLFVSFTWISSESNPAGDVIRKALRRERWRNRIGM